MPATKTATASSKLHKFKPTLAELAYQEMRRQILDLQLPPGAVVSERVLAERLKMGKAPIRSALIRLASDGLITIASRQGIVISTPSIQDVIELFQIRLAMELMIVRQIAGALREEQIGRLRANLADYRRVAETADPDDALSIDFDFHRLLCEFHGNRQMARVLDRVLDLLYREVRAGQQRFPRRIWSSVEEHQAVADAISEGNPQRAEDLMKAHLRFAEQFILSSGAT